MDRKAKAEALLQLSQREDVTQDIRERAKRMHARLTWFGGDTYYEDVRKAGGEAAYEKKVREATYGKPQQRARISAIRQKVASRGSVHQPKQNQQSPQPTTATANTRDEYALNPAQITSRAALLGKDMPQQPEDLSLTPEQKQARSALWKQDNIIPSWTKVLWPTWQMETWYTYKWTPPTEGYITKSVASSLSPQQRANVDFYKKHGWEEPWFLTRFFWWLTWQPWSVPMYGPNDKRRNLLMQQAMRELEMERKTK